MRKGYFEKVSLATMFVSTTIQYNTHKIPLRILFLIIILQLRKPNLRQQWMSFKGVSVIYNQMPEKPVGKSTTQLPSFLLFYPSDKTVC